MSYMLDVVLRVVLYVLLVTMPVILSAILRPGDVDPFPVELATRFALLGFSILAMQFVIAARIRWIEKPFGLDQLFRFHKAMAVVAALLLISHPTLLAASHNTWILFTSFNMPPVIIVGRICLYLLLIFAVVSIFRKALHVEYQKWLKGHNIVAISILIAVSFHVYIFSGDMEKTATHMMLALLLILGIAGYIKQTFVDTILAKKKAYTITGVKQETPNIWTIEMAPYEGNILEYLPGQFHFLTLYRKCCKKIEEHPFTISSSLDQRKYVSSTIKASGDYTSTISLTEQGDLAAIKGPFGRFSYVLYPEERDLVFISGGIGVTPFMSMLRHMRDTGTEINVRMLYFCRTEKDIAFRDELSEIEKGYKPVLNLTYILSSPDTPWQGETGYPDRSMIARLVGNGLTSKTYYICGPSLMMKTVISSLRELGVPADKIRYENFSL